MARRKPEFQTLDLSTWPTVAWTVFDAAERESIRARTTAIEQYACGATIKEIEQSTGVNRRQLIACSSAHSQRIQTVAFMAFAR